MTDLSEKIIEAGARALVERDGWDFDNMPRPVRAQYLGASKTALLAVLPMLAEDAVRIIEDNDEWSSSSGRRGLSPRTPGSLSSLAYVDAQRAHFSSLIEDLSLPKDPAS